MYHDQLIAPAAAATAAAADMDRYDKMSARELFRQWGVSQRCYDEFLRCAIPLMPLVCAWFTANDAESNRLIPMAP